MQTKKHITAKLKIFTRLISLFTILILLDQLSKYLTYSRNKFYICNENMAWGIKITRPIIFGIGLSLIIFLFYILYKKVSILYQPTNSSSLLSKKLNKCDILGIVLVLSGAISNMLDRVYLGCIIDFINLKFWPTFNLADSFIVTGVVLLLAKYWKL